MNKTKSSNFSFLIIIVLSFFFLFESLSIPFHFDRTFFGYVLKREGTVIIPMEQIEVSLAGKHIWRLWKQDDFEGTLSIKSNDYQIGRPFHTEGNVLLSGSWHGYAISYSRTSPYTFAEMHISQDGASLILPEYDSPYHLFVVAASQQLSVLEYEELLLSLLE